MTDKQETYLAPKEFALATGVCLKTVYHWLRGDPKTGKPYLQAERRGPRLWFIPESELLRVKRG